MRFCVLLSGPAEGRVEPGIESRTRGKRLDMAESRDRPEVTSADKLTWNGTFTMAVGGMVGGGIFSVLGVVIALAGPWAWASFLIAGCVALLAALSYVALSTTWGQDGGSYGYLKHLGHLSAAGNLSWILISGYVLTMAVYAFTFGHYLSNVLGVSPGVWSRVFGVGIVAVLVGLNLRTVGDNQRVEEITVWAKLAVLLVLAGIGLWRFDAAALNPPGLDVGIGAVLLGAASVFMAYEGFQLLAYDYDDIRSPERTMARAVPPAVVVVTITYVLVALGAASLVGAATLIEQKEIALAVAGEEALGAVGLVAVTIAAVFSTGSAINATLFATARLAGRVADDGQLPRRLRRRNAAGVPSGAVLVLGAAAAVLAVVGGLATLVEAASLVFLVTFAIVGGVAVKCRIGSRVVAVLGCAGATAAAIGLTGRLALQHPVALGVLLAFVVGTCVVRPRVAHAAGLSDTTAAD